MICKGDGTLVMGAGVAKDFATRFPDIPKIWGEATLLIKNGKLKSNIIVTPHSDDLSLVSFPTKYNWKDKSDLDLIKRSAIQLYTISQALGWKKILLPRPGCSNGGLLWGSQVKPLLETILDERFWVICKP